MHARIRYRRQYVRPALAEIAAFNTAMHSEEYSPSTHTEEKRVAVESAWLVIQACLETKKDALSTEIRSYPPPVPACDQQFNYLLAERSRITQALNQLNTLTRQSQMHPNPEKTVEQFIQSSPDIDETTQQKIVGFLL